MEALLLLLLLALGSGGRGTTGSGSGGSGSGGNGGYPGGPAGTGSVPKGDPPGGCRLAYDSPHANVVALNMLGYTPSPLIWGPDNKLGTYDADQDPEVLQFQLDYNQASRSKYLGSDAGGVTPDGLMGKCTMAAIAYVDVAVGAQAWRARYMPKVSLGVPGG